MVKTKCMPELMCEGVLQIMVLTVSIGAPNKVICIHFNIEVHDFTIVFGPCVRERQNIGIFVPIVGKQDCIVFIFVCDRSLGCFSFILQRGKGVAPCLCRLFDCGRDLL